MPTDHALAHTYLHIGDGGVTVSVSDDGRAPVLEFRLDCYGTPATITAKTTKDSLREIGEMLLSVANADHPWGEPYAYGARLCSSRRYGQEQVLFVGSEPGEASGIGESESEGG